MSKVQRSGGKQLPDYKGNKKAFDGVMEALRRMGTPTVGPVGAINFGGGGGGKPAAANPAKPTMVEFRCDVFKAIGRACPKDINMRDFHLAYTLYDSDDYIDRELHAQKLLHDRRHSVEQRIGAEFKRVKLYPVQGRGYFYSVRKTRGSV